MRNRTVEFYVLTLPQRVQSVVFLHCVEGGVVCMDRSMLRVVLFAWTEVF